MYFYSFNIYILCRFLGISLSRFFKVEMPDLFLPPPNWFPHLNPLKVEHWTTRAHSPTQTPTNPNTMIIVSAEDDLSSIWESD